MPRQTSKPKRTARVTTQASRLGTNRAGTGWASRQAGKRHNRGKKVSMRTIRKRGRQRGGG